MQFSREWRKSKNIRSIAMIVPIWVAMFIFLPNASPPTLPIGESKWVSESDAWDETVLPQHQVVFYENGEGYPIIIVGGAGRTTADLNSLSTIIAENNLKAVATDIGLQMNYGSAKNNKTDKADKYALWRLKHARNEVLDDSNAHRRYCLIGQDYGAHVVRNFIPFLVGQADENIPSAVILLSPYGDITFPTRLRPKNRR